MDKGKEPDQGHGQVINLNLDTGQEYSRQRERFWQVWLPKNPPPPARTSLELDDAEVSSKHLNAFH